MTDYTPPTLTPLEDQVLQEYRRLNANLDTVRSTALRDSPADV